MFLFIKNLYNYRELFYALSLSYIKARYKQTVLGTGWALVQPAVLMLTVIFVFPMIANITPAMKPYSLFVFVGFWLWTFFSNSLSFSIPNLVSNTSLLRKIYFPREILIVAAVVPSLLDFALALAILIVMMIYFGIHLTFFILLLPILFFIFILFTLGLSFLGAIANVAFRDVSKFLPIMLQILFFATPIIYSFDNVRSSYILFYKLNPLTGIIDSFRSIIIHGRIDHPFSLAYATGASIAIFLAGYYIFKKGEQVIADII